MGSKELRIESDEWPDVSMVISYNLSHPSNGRLPNIRMMIGQLENHSSNSACRMQSSHKISQGSMVSKSCRFVGDITDFSNNSETTISDIASIIEKALKITNDIVDKLRAYGCFA